MQINQCTNGTKATRGIRELRTADCELRFLSTGYDLKRARERGQEVIAVRGDGLRLLPHGEVLGVGHGVAVGIEAHLVREDLLPEQRHDEHEDQHEDAEVGLCVRHR